MARTIYLSVTPLFENGYYGETSKYTVNSLNVPIP